MIPTGRCTWAVGEEYVTYHDQEWGRPVHGETALFERISLEAFQTGLSWITILRKREGFRAAFAGFDVDAVAAFGPEEVAQLSANPQIIRSAAKIGATIGNARAVQRLREQGGLDSLVWSFADREPSAGPRSEHDVPTRTPASEALARALRGSGLSYVGPVNMYAAMQACGLVNDHLVGCPAR